MPQEPTDLIDTADQISTARDFVELIHMAHSRPEDAPTAAAVDPATGGTVTSIMGLFHQLQTLTRFIKEADVDDDQLNYLCAAQDGYVARMLEMPATTVQEWVAKVYAASDRGSTWAPYNQGTLWAEAEAILKGGAQ